MNLYPKEHEWNTRYDKFLIWGSWVNALIYALPLALLFSVVWYLGVPEKFWVLIFVIYLIGAIAHLLNYGFMALNIQIKVSTDLIIEQMKQNSN